MAPIKLVSPLVFCSVLVFSFGCASQPKAGGAGGLSVRIAGDGACRTVDNRGADKKNAPGAVPLADDQLCKQLSEALGQALGRKGFKLVSGEAESADIVAALKATQTATLSEPPASRGTVRLHVSLRAMAGTDEVDSFIGGSQQGEPEQLVASIGETAQSLADEMAASPRVRAIKPARAAAVQ